MRIEELRFEYDEDVLGLAAYHDGIDLVIQPVGDVFIAEAIDGVKIHALGKHQCLREAMVALLEKVNEIVEAKTAAAVPVGTTIH